MRDHRDGLNPACGTKLTKLASRLPDMPCIHIAARTFTRCSVHLTICGATFNLVVFDRAGGAVSMDYNIHKDTFVCIICQLGRDLEAFDLGLDRKVVPLDILGSWNQFSGFRVKVGGLLYPIPVLNRV